MKKNYSVSVEDNGAAFIVVINAGTTDRLVVGAFSTLGEAWGHIEFMYKVESQDFFIKSNRVVPVSEWLEGMRKAGFLE